MQIELSDYQIEQLQALAVVIEHLAKLKEAEMQLLQEKIYTYLSFRTEVDQFLTTHFKDICTQSCYQNQISACCTREGIITFFADVVINAIQSTKIEREQLAAALRSGYTDKKCIYLGASGCQWQIKPLVCEMFLCQKAEDAVLKNNPSLAQAWNKLKQRAKQFRWPDRPVLFDELEQVFIDAGYSSSLMYLHKSPGLRRVKKCSRKSNQV
ncbi:MAG: hypothetical protein KJO34_01760 [Deltaproteobacteria bacterium]|nr:hypothetical protein [Deltaproteobacteria bacterium]